MHVPSEIGNPGRQRFDHVDRHHGSRGIVQAEPNAPDAAGMEAGQLRVRDRRVKDGDATGTATKLRDRVECDRVLGCIVAWRHDHHPRGADTLLQQPVLGHGRVARGNALAGCHRKPGRVVDVDMAVARARWGLEGRRLGTAGVRDARLSLDDVRAESAGTRCEGHMLQEGPAASSDHRRESTTGGTSTPAAMIRDASEWPATARCPTPGQHPLVALPSPDLFHIANALQRFRDARPRAQGPQHVNQRDRRGAGSGCRGRCSPLGCCSVTARRRMVRRAAKVCASSGEIGDWSGSTPVQSTYPVSSLMAR
jgi:hypothetical protein